MQPEYGFEIPDLAMQASPSSVRAQVTIVTPSMARTWLNKRHPRQMERYSEKVATGYAEQMRAGTWDPGHPQGIIISNDGFLLDGQHRLEALCMFNRPVQMLVIQGVSKESYKHLDAGFPRTLAFRSGRHRDDMAIYTAILGLATYGQVKPRYTVEQVDACATFIQHDLETFYRLATRAHKNRLNPAPLRAAVVLRLRDQPDRVDEICQAYNNYLSGDFHAAPRSMSVLYKRMTEAYNPHLTNFYLGWKAFDPKRFDNAQLKMVNMNEEIKNLQKTLLAPLVASLRT